MNTVLVPGVDDAKLSLPIIQLPSGREVIAVNGGPFLDTPQFTQLAVDGKIEGGRFHFVGLKQPNFANLSEETGVISLNGLRIELCVIDGGNFKGCLISDFSLIDCICINTDFSGVNWDVDSKIDFTGTAFKACNFAGCDSLDLEKLCFDKAFSDFQTIWPEGYAPQTSPYKMGITTPAFEGIWKVGRA